MATSNVIKLTNVRIAFPEIFKPKAFQSNDNPRYSLTALLDPESKQHQAIIAEVKEAADAIYKEQWGAKKLKLLGTCFGDEEKDYDGFQGAFWVRASAAVGSPPVILNRRREVVSESDGLIYAGCRCSVHITLWTQDNQWGKRINGNLLGVQFVGHDEAFTGSGGVYSASNFDELDDAEEDEEEVAF